MKRLVLCVEGTGDVAAVPTLVKRLLEEIGPWEDLLLDDRPIETRSIGNLVKNDFNVWKRYLGNAMKRHDARGVLLVLDGDDKPRKGQSFCAVRTARSLARAAEEVGAGKTFSVAVVFAMQEFETWLLAGAASLAGLRLKDDRAICSDARAPDRDLESAPRDAKKVFNKLIVGCEDFNKYRPSLDQTVLARAVDLEAIRSRNLRSFRRLEAAVSSMRDAILNDRPIASPS